MLTRPPTAYDDKIYGSDWRAYADPAMPETIAPTALLIDRHLGTSIEHKAALLVDGVPRCRSSNRVVGAISSGTSGSAQARQSGP